MNGYSIYLKSAVGKLKYRSRNEASKRLVPKERQALAITLIVGSIPILVTIVALAFNLSI